VITRCGAPSQRRQQLQQQQRSSSSSSLEADEMRGRRKKKLRARQLNGVTLLTTPSVRRRYHEWE
jgi:hypothetical protein